MEKINRIIGYPRLYCPLIKQWMDPFTHYRGCVKCKYCEGIERHDDKIQVHCTAPQDNKIESWFDAPYKIDCPLHQKWIFVYDEKSEESCVNCCFCKAIHYLKHHVEVECGFVKGINRKIK